MTTFHLLLACHVALASPAVARLRRAWRRVKEADPNALRCIRAVDAICRPGAGVSLRDLQARAAAAVAAALAVTLGASSASVQWLVPAWLAFEVALFNLARLEADSWWGFLRGADGFVFSAVCNLCWYLVVSAAPLLTVRPPMWVCPPIWAGGTVAALLSNFALLSAAVHLAGGGDTEALAAFPAFEVLGACAGAEALGFLLVWANVVERFRPTLWRRRTVRQHCEETMWVICAPSSTYGPTRNDSRARKLATYTNRYWPSKALVTAWLRENWDAIKAARWHTAEWRAHFPASWLPPS